MRFFIAAVSVVAIIASHFVIIQCQEEDIMTMKKQAVTECTIEHNISKEDVNSIINHKSVPNDPQVKCWLGCVFKKLGVLKEGKVDWGRCTMLTKHCLSNIEDKAKVDEITKICQAEVSQDENDECQLAYSVAACKINNWKNFGLPTGEIKEL